MSNRDIRCPHCEKRYKPKLRWNDTSKCPNCEGIVDFRRVKILRIVRQLLFYAEFALFIISYAWLKDLIENPVLRMVIYGAIVIIASEYLNGLIYIVLYNVLDKKFDFVKNGYR